jgi:YD repeat-containing protein
MSHQKCVRIALVLCAGPATLVFSGPGCAPVHERAATAGDPPMTLTERRMQVARDYPDSSVVTGRAGPTTTGGSRPSTDGLRSARRRAAATIIDGVPANGHAFRVDGHEIPDVSGVVDAVQPGEIITVSVDVYNDDGDFLTDAVHQVKVTWGVLQCDGSEKVFDFNQVVAAHSFPFGGPTPRVSAQLTVPNICPSSNGLTRSVITVTATEVSTGGAGETGWIILALPDVPVEQTYGCVCGPSSTGKPRLQNYRGDPINTATGAYTELATDAALRGIGVPLAVQRSYSSNDAVSTPLGPGWTMPWFASLTVQASGDVVFRAEDGNRYRYTKTSSGSFRAPLLSRSSLARSGSGYALTTPDRRTLSFDATGHLMRIADRTGHGLSLTYSAGLIDTITDALGRSVTLGYAAGLLTEVRLPGGGRITYGYLAGRLASATTPGGGTTAYTYDSGGRLDSIQDGNGHLVVRNTYNAAGQVISQQDAAGATMTFEYNESETDITYPDGGVWTDVYTGNVLAATYDPLGNKIAFHFDGAWNLTYASSPLGNPWTMAYDSAGNLVSRTAPAPLSFKEQWTYDANNKVVSL